MKQRAQHSTPAVLRQHRVSVSYLPQVKLAEHIDTGLHVAIKILNMNRVLSSEMKDKVRGGGGCCKLSNRLAVSFVDAK